MHTLLQWLCTACIGLAGDEQAASCAKVSLVDAKTCSTLHIAADLSACGDTVVHLADPHCGEKSPDIEIEGKKSCYRVLL
jgi:hypothetical protein